MPLPGLAARSAGSDKLGRNARRRRPLSDDDYVYDEASGEWRPASEIAAASAAAGRVEAGQAQPAVGGEG